MNFVKIFVSLMILFVAANLALMIYKLLNRKWREGLENAGECPGSYCMDKGVDSVCHGSNVPCGNNTKSASDIPSSSPALVPASVSPALTSPNDVRIPGAPPPSAAQKRVFDDMVSGRSGMSSDPLSDGSVIPGPAAGQAAGAAGQAAGAAGQAAGPGPAAAAAGAGPGPAAAGPAAAGPAAAPVGLCNASWEGKPSQPCLEGKCYDVGESCPAGNGVCRSGCCSRKDESSPYLCVDSPGPSSSPGQPGSGASTPASVGTCDVLAIHNQSAHTSTYGQWFPPKVSQLNLPQHKYEHAGRKFLNEESIKKGIRTPMMLASEAEVLGRLLWRVHLAAITQICMKNIPQSVTTTMNDELALMKKVHQIQNNRTGSSISGSACEINTSTQPKQTVNCPTTGMMTDRGNRPGADATNSINSTIPSVSGGSSAYATNYKPRNPNKKPKPYDSIWDIF